jgi:acyl carrier protein
LDGWWLYEDAADRLPGSPLLNSKLWINILKETGFNQVEILNRTQVKDNYFPQRVFLSESDGIIIENKKTIKKFRETETDYLKKMNKGNVYKDKIKKMINNTKSNTYDKKAVLQEYIEDKVINCVSFILQIDKKEIDMITPFSEFGVDSISALKIIKALNDYLHIDLEPTDLFNYSTIQNLCSYILKRFKHIIQIKSSFNENYEDLGLICKTEDAGGSKLNEKTKFKDYLSTKDKVLLWTLKDLEDGNAEADEVYRFFKEKF